jgi:hypothetical protein
MHSQNNLIDRAESIEDRDACVKAKIRIHRHQDAKKGHFAGSVICRRALDSELQLCSE